MYARPFGSESFLETVAMGCGYDVIGTMEAEAVRHVEPFCEFVTPVRVPLQV